MLKFSRLVKSFHYALHGLAKVMREEQNFQVQSISAILVLILAVYFRISRMEWIFLISVIISVFLMEVVNSAIERISDVIKPRINTYVKEIKDIMAGAVLLASLLAIIVGLIIFYPYFLNLF